MSKLMQWVGGFWAFVGFGGLAIMPWTEGSPGILAAGLVLNGALFILPGLAVMGIGRAIHKPGA